MSIKTHSRALRIDPIIDHRQMKLQITELNNAGDQRGFSFTMPAAYDPKQTVARKVV